jgi:ActR/RegA family two-component response regulator
MPEHQLDSRRETLRNWTIFCALIAAFEIAGVFAANRFGDIGAADEEESRMPTVLLVENDDDERFLYQEALRRQGCVVAAAADPASALLRIQREPPTAVVLGTESGEWDGLPMLTRIHELKPDLPVIVNGACSSCESGIADRTPDTYYSDSPSSDDVKRAVLSALGGSGAPGG